MKLLLDYFLGFFSSKKKKTNKSSCGQNKNDYKKAVIRSTHSKYKSESVVKQPQAWNPDLFQVDVVEGQLRFHDFPLVDDLMHAIFDLGFRYCTPIQAQVLQATLKGSDAIGKAQTGTGKTAAFLITLLNRLTEIKAPDVRYTGEPRAIILAPTRELALQIDQECQKLMHYLNFKLVTLIGGMNIQKQIAHLKSDYVDIIVATPGRLLDLCQSQDVYLDMVEILVIDEADRMLDMGFIDQIRKIVRMTPRVGDRQTLLFSATFTDTLKRLGEQWTYHPIQVDITNNQKMNSNIDQHFYMVSDANKKDLLVKLILDLKQPKVIVFTNWRHLVKALCQDLISEKIKAGYISGEIMQSQRTATLTKFKEGQLEVLVATDVAGRGIHIDQVTHVINYHLPESCDDYIHRIGRTGRAGNKGVAISFIGEDDAFFMPKLVSELTVKPHIHYY